MTLDIPAGATVYLLMGNAGPAARSRNAAASMGWTTKIGDVLLYVGGRQDSSLGVYGHTFNESQHVTIPGGGFAGVIVISQRLIVGSAGRGNVPAVPQEAPRQFAPAAEDNAPIDGPVTPIKRKQTEIKSLYVMMEDSGELLGLSLDLILTATPGSSPGYTPVRFVSPVGQGMIGVLDDVLRAIHVDYPKWAASKVEISFEDRETPKDGGSIGAAIGTLVLSMLQGFEIDNRVAITGDVTADSRLRAIGGVAAKIRGATAAGCGVVILPVDNYEQVVDAMVYEGPALVTDIQVIGAANLKEAAGLARVDREEKIAQAIDAFGSIAPILKQYPGRIHTKAIENKLKRVLELEPNHFSAKLLLEVAEYKQPTKLSADASFYYWIVAANQAIPSIFATDGAASPVQVDEQVMIKLRKLRTQVDPKILPIVNASVDFFQAAIAVNAGRGSIDAFERQRQRLRTALGRLQRDRALIEKMLHEGV